MPVQPTRTAVQLLREISLKLSSLGIELLSPEFVSVALRYCRQRLALLYAEIGGDTSSDAALQLLADVIFLEIALASPTEGEFDTVKKKLLVKVSWIND